MGACEDRRHKFKGSQIQKESQEEYLLRYQGQLWANWTDVWFRKAQTTITWLLWKVILATASSQWIELTLQRLRQHSKIGEGKSNSNWQVEGSSEVTQEEWKEDSKVEQGVWNHEESQIWG